MRQESIVNNISLAGCFCSWVSGQDENDESFADSLPSHLTSDKPHVIGEEFQRRGSPGYKGNSKGTYKQGKGKSGMGGEEHGR